VSKQTASSTSNSRGTEYRPAFWALKAAREGDAKDMNRRFKTLVALKKR
jgi:hypothetical protein